MKEHRTPWPHAPLHQLSQRGTYFVTTGTYQKAHHFRSRERLQVMHRGLLAVARDFGWRLEAWPVPVANQYPWCSAAWFERTASPAMVKSIYRFKVDQVKVYDEFEAAKVG